MDSRRTARVLLDINHIRTQRHLEPLTAIPRGKRGCPYSCPLAIALRARVSLAWWEGGPLSPVLRHFRRDFDNGRLPEFEEEES